jgi:esterase/lipase superfamily enzyme
VGVSGHASLYSPAIGADGNVVVHGHYGRPVLVFPSEGGSAWDFESNGMLGAVGGLVEAGRVKLYCVDAFDSGERWRYESWIIDQVAPFIQHDVGGTQDILTTGCSMGAFHAANFVLRRADLFPAAICLSGNYDFGITDEVSGLHGDHLDWLRSRVSLLLVCGQGMWEDTTGALESTKRLAWLLGEKGIRHELDLWGHDVPHDWPSWRAQIAHHLPRFC